MIRNQFYTCFLLIYFLFGLILYDVLSIQFIDEVLVLILVLYTIVYALETRKRIHKETICFFMVCIFYLLYSFSIGITSIKANLYDFQQQIKPYLAFYCTLYLSPTFTKKQIYILRKYIVVLSVLVGGIICSGSSRLFFGGPLAALATTTLTLSLYYYFFSATKTQIGIKSLLIMSLGIFSGKAKFFSEYLVAAYLLLFRKTKIKLTSLKVIFSSVILVIVILVCIWEKFDFYFVSGFQSSEKLARPLLYKTSVEILKDYIPFGTGLGTFCNEASRVFYSPIFYEYGLNNVYGLTPKNSSFAADCFYPTLAQFGFVGIILFFLFWRKRYMQISSCFSKKKYIIGNIIIIILLFESIADTSYLSNRGVLFFILLALVSCDKKAAN